ncbi:MAG: GNAT family N-acetyltransferase [Dehalococcoidales bacterium]|nr:GNAT family N-acetyltransferase [Dehalococcoidales bacterium]
MYQPLTIGEKIYFSPLNKEDFVTNMLRWVNDPEVTHYMFTGTLPATLEQLEEEYKQITKSKNEVVFAIIDKEANKYIGNIGLYQINWTSRTAEMRRFIGEKKVWKKGYGTEAAKLIVAYGFERLNLNRIWAGNNVENIGSWKSNEKAGFKREGILRQEIYRNGKYYDAVRHGILREEYFANKGK